MKKRKHLCLIISDVKSMTSGRILNGILMQCKKYDYDLSVFTSAANLKYFDQQYTDGETNIYNLIDFEQFDGIIVDTLSLSNVYKDVLSDIFKNIKERAKCPVVNLSVEYEGYKTIVSQNEAVLRSMCRHMTNVHGYQKIYILTGPKGNGEAEQRLEVIKDELEKNYIDVSSSDIFYGDFWYSAGEQLADRIASGEVEQPEAVICTSNHMGIGLINRLVKHRYRVPENIAVIAFDTVELAALNDISLTSYDANAIGTSANAVDYIRSIIEPDQDLQPYTYDSELYFSPGRSCGCKNENRNIIKILGPSIYRTDRNFDDEDLFNKIDIGYLMEGDCYDRLCASKDIEDCLSNILTTAYNVFPFEKFYLCLRDHWEDFNEDITLGYPDRMKIVVKRDETGGQSFHSNMDGVMFDTKDMLPDLFAAREEPSVFYFLPIHFGATNFGYSVLQRKQDSKLVDVVYRNWIRFICSSLEMIRIRETYMHISIKDAMTGLTNKRGMYEALGQMLLHIKPEESIYVAVIDMDGLKYINDHFGHIEGDVCIKRLAHVITLVTRKNEISIRAGGDEFYIIGAGEYTEEMLEEKIAEFEQVIHENEEFEGKEYKLSASIGNTLWNQGIEFDIDEMIQVADQKMYDYKNAHKKARKD